MSRLHNTSDPGFRLDATISSGESVSAVIDNTQLGSRGLQVLVPSAWTLADIGFEVSADETAATDPDNATWIPLRDESGNVVKISGIQTAAQMVYAAPAAVWGLGSWPYFRLVSLDSTVGLLVWTPLVQGSDRALQAVIVS